MYLETISFKELEHYIGKENVRIIDLRTRELFLKSHISGALNIPFDELENYRCFFHKEELIILYCDRGNNSLLACRDLSYCDFQAMAVIGIFSEYKGSALLVCPDDHSADD